MQFILQFVFRCKDYMQYLNIATNWMQMTCGGFHNELGLVSSRVTSPNLGLAENFLYLLG